MRQALDLAEQARGRTNPNPLVGAVLVKAGAVVGTGYHRQAGTPHAEIHALEQAGEHARGADLYVSLEPCSHFGRTPPCCDALIRAGVAKVFVALEDPNPQVSGQGIARLRAAGIPVEVGLLAREAARQNEVFLTYIRTRRPFVLAKAAMSLDGKIAAASGDSRWVSGEASRACAHRLRDEYDAVLVGIGTVLKDDPQLNVRLPAGSGAAHHPVRVVLDSALRLPLDCRLVRTAAEQALIVFCRPDFPAARAAELERRGVEVIPVASAGEQLDLPQILDILGAQQLCSLLVEGGGEVQASFFRQGLVDKLCWFIAPKIVGGRDAPSPVGGTGVVLMRDAAPVYEVSWRQLGQDFCLEGYLRPQFMNI
jgi:diaminohydroxyphosphoribosylaminopyrimidine deaminase/5-amino-6-(5-phosphoribosylamino)uracil reductase